MQLTVSTILRTYHEELWSRNTMKKKKKIRSYLFKSIKLNSNLLRILRSLLREEIYFFVRNEAHIYAVIQ